MSLPSTREKESIYSPADLSHLVPVAVPSFIFSMPSVLSTFFIFIRDAFENSANLTDCSRSKNKWAIEGSYSRESEVPGGDNRIVAVPIKGNAVVPYTGVMIFAVLGGNEIISHCIICQCFEAMGKARGDVEGLMIIKGELLCLEFTI